MPFFTSAVEKRAGEKGNVRKFLFSPSLLLKLAGNRQKQMQDKKRKTEKQ